MSKNMKLLDMPFQFASLFAENLMQQFSKDLFATLGSMRDFGEIYVVHCADLAIMRWQWIVFGDLFGIAWMRIRLG